MKLASFSWDDTDRIGAALNDGTIVDLAEAVRALRGDLPPGWPGDMIGFIEAGTAAIDTAREAVARASANFGAVKRYRPEEIVWHAPVRRPSKICCLALNNSANSDRIMSGPDHPALFVKAANALVGHTGAIEVGPNYGRVHPEPELAVVIGKRAKSIRAEDAYEHVFGYTVHNDITSPTMRGEDTFHYRAIHPAKHDASEIAYVDTYVSYPGRYKCADTFSPLGPWLVTRDDIADPHDLAIACRHKGELVTEDNTGNLTYKIPEALAFITAYMTLLPGDVVSMGTALKRSGPATRAVQNVDLHALGGPVSVTIERIGTLENQVVRI